MPASFSLRALVVDDEAPARQRLRDLLRRTPGVASIDEAVDGRGAVDIIRHAPPDLVFLDVQMPELDGLGVIAAIGAHRMPPTIFVTAFDRHAIQAFEANALDYLLKPFSDERFETTIARAWSRLDSHHASGLAARLARLLDAAPEPLDKLAVKHGAHTLLLAAPDLDWIQSAGVYVTLHSQGKEYLHRASLTELERQLDPRRFLRVHRSAIVNIERIERLEPISHGEFYLVMRGGTKVRLSRSFKAALEERLRQPL